MSVYLQTRTKYLNKPFLSALEVRQGVKPNQLEGEQVRGERWEVRAEGAAPMGLSRATLASFRRPGRNLATLQPTRRIKPRLLLHLSGICKKTNTLVRTEEQSVLQRAPRSGSRSVFTTSLPVVTAAVTCRRSCTGTERLVRSAQMAVKL